jgi:hypothetical protein
MGSKFDARNKRSTPSEASGRIVAARKQMINNPK